VKPDVSPVFDYCHVEVRLSPKPSKRIHAVLRFTAVLRGCRTARVAEIGVRQLEAASMDGFGGLEYFPDEALRLAVRVGQERRQKRYSGEKGYERAAQPQPVMQASYRGPTGAGQAMV
jgi:hypothetical protein